MITQLFNSNIGRIIISIIWGLGLAALFRRVCKGRNCLIIKGPNPVEVSKSIYEYNGKCYKYSTHNVSCKKSDNIPI